MNPQCRVSRAQALDPNSAGLNTGFATYQLHTLGKLLGWPKISFGFSIRCCGKSRMKFLTNQMLKSSVPQCLPLYNGDIFVAAYLVGFL